MNDLGMNLHPLLRLVHGANAELVEPADSVQNKPRHAFRRPRLCGGVRPDGGLCQEQHVVGHVQDALAVRSQVAVGVGGRKRPKQ